MELLNKPINSFDFAYIVEFCKQGHVEGIQLDYKKDLSDKGLAKDFAAFSNTRGGVIIIGVEEDHDRSIPKAWDGVLNAGKAEDRIDQFAANVDPLPNYEIHVTDDYNGKVFILVRIFEGDRTPYYVQNDANLWVRTGSIKKPIDIAGRDMTELMFGKKEKAEQARNNYLRRAEELRVAALQRAEGGKADRFLDTTTLKIAVQPFYPRRALIAPSELPALSAGQMVVSGKDSTSFPRHTRESESIPDGILRFFSSNDDDQSYRSYVEQIYATGLVYYAESILRIGERGHHLISLGQIAANLYLVLNAASKYYHSVGYQGGLDGRVALNNTKDKQLQIRTNVLLGFNHETRAVLLAEYEWKLDLDTSLLGNPTALQSYFLDLIRQISWDLGYPDLQNDWLYGFLRREGWLILDNAVS